MSRDLGYLYPETDCKGAILLFALCQLVSYAQNLILTILILTSIQIFRNSLESVMPSTRRQKAKSKRSREADIVSKNENTDIMVGSSNLEVQDEWPEFMYTLIGTRKLVDFHQRLP